MRHQCVVYGHDEVGWVGPASPGKRPLHMVCVRHSEEYWDPLRMREESLGCPPSFGGVSLCLLPQGLGLGRSGVPLLPSQFCGLPRG